jgi:hypothetical protein
MTASSPNFMRHAHAWNENKSKSRAEWSSNA